MKKLILSLLCVGSILALPGCWCCRKTCEEPCEESYDECDDYCDKGHYRCGEEDDDRDVVGYEEQQGYRKPLLRKSSRSREESGPRRKVMYKEINPGIISQAEAEGKECKFLDPRYHAANKGLNKKSRMENGSKRNARSEVQAMEVDVEEEITK